MTSLNQQPTIILAGGSGFIGQQLASHLQHSGYHVVILTRAQKHVQSATDAMNTSVEYVHWDGTTLGPWAKHLENAVAIVNLAGRNVDCRYTEDHKREILESRIGSVTALDAAIKQCENPPPVWVQAATLAIYGHRGDQLLTESAHIGRGFSPEVAHAWEQAVLKAGYGEEKGQPPNRKVILRISFVLGNTGGALPTLARLARLGLGGSVGDGQQYYSWIHIDDLCAITQQAITDSQMQGIYNVTSPTPVRNHVFMKLLRKAVHRPWSPPAPAWAIKVGCFFLRTEAELALRSRNGVPARLQAMNYPFKFTTLQSALKNLYPNARF